MLTATELKMLKMLQNNPELLARVQDVNAFSELKEETRIDRNHRFVLSAINATERTNFTNDEREVQDSFIEEVCDVLDEAIKLIVGRFKVKSNEKGEAWHALSYLAENGQTLNFKIATEFGHKVNSVWVEPETVETPAVPKPSRPVKK